jgi:hypothetical protein
MTQSYMRVKGCLGQMRRLPEMLRRKFKEDGIWDVICEIYDIRVTDYDLGAGILT